MLKYFGTRVLKILGSLNSDISEGCCTSTGSGFFALLSRDFEQIFGQNASLRLKTLNNINLVASTHIKREKRYLLVEVCRSKTLLLKIPIIFLSKASCSIDRIPIVIVICNLFAHGALLVFRGVDSP